MLLLCCCIASASLHINHAGQLLYPVEQQVATLDGLQVQRVLGIRPAQTRQTQQSQPHTPAEHAAIRTVRKPVGRHRRLCVSLPVGLWMHRDKGHAFRMTTKSMPINITHNRGGIIPVHGEPKPNSQSRAAHACRRQAGMPSSNSAGQGLMEGQHRWARCGDTMQQLKPSGSTRFCLPGMC